MARWSYDDTGKGKSVKEVLIIMDLEKHCEQFIPDPEAFISCNKLPILIDVDVSSDHFKKVAHSLSRSGIASIN